MKKTTYLLILFSLVIGLTAACSGLPVEDQSATNMVQTVQAVNQDATKTILPSLTATATEVTPSTATSSPVVTDTLTPETPSTTPTDTPSAQTSDVSTNPTYTPLPFIAKTKYSTVRIVNSTGKQVTVQLNGAQIYNTTVGKSTIIKVRFDTYYFTIFIGKDGPYNGSIFINNIDRYTIFVDEGNVRVATP